MVDVPWSELGPPSDTCLFTPQQYVGNFTHISGGFCLCTQQLYCPHTSKEDLLLLQTCFHHSCNLRIAFAFHQLAILRVMLHRRDS